MSYPRCALCRWGVGVHSVTVTDLATGDPPPLDRVTYRAQVCPGCLQQLVDGDTTRVVIGATRNAIPLIPPAT